MDIPLITILGAVLVFGTGIAIIGNEVEIKTGENITNTLTINGSISSQLIRDNYEPYDFGGVGSTSFGRIITILGFILFIFSLISIRS